MTTFERFVRIWNFPALPAGCGTECMVRDVSETDREEFWCTCLNMPTKVFLNLFNYLPKMLIAIILAFMGSLWLLSSESFGDLILNSLALEFVTQVDELLARTFFPNFFAVDCLNPFMYRYKKAPGRESDDGDMAWRVRQYCGAFFKACVALGIVQALMKLQQVIPGYANDVGPACKEFFESQWPWCSPFQEDCFPTN
mmetsp:Transcript_26830/g.48977  ORF Transcript_26830/g.48977 Transcript_26830/m.48977 type:complete len:198 (-) Transcript_26830:137-730(-)